MAGSGYFDASLKSHFDDGEGDTVAGVALPADGWAAAVINCGGARGIFTRSVRILWRDSHARKVLLCFAAQCAMVCLGFYLSATTHILALSADALLSSLVLMAYLSSFVGMVSMRIDSGATFSFGCVW